MDMNDDRHLTMEYRRQEIASRKEAVELAIKAGTAPESVTEAADTIYRFLHHYWLDKPTLAGMSKEQGLMELRRVVRLFCDHPNMTDEEKLEALSYHPYFHEPAK